MGTLNPCSLRNANALVWFTVDSTKMRVLSPLRFFRDFFKPGISIICRNWIVSFLGFKALEAEEALKFGKCLQYLLKAAVCCVCLRLIFAVFII